MNTFIKTLLPFVIFQAQWWLCIISNNYNEQYGYCFAAIIFLLNLFYQPLTKSMLLFLLILSGFGIINDTILLKLGVFRFAGYMDYLIPAWLMVLWFCFCAWFINAKWLNLKLSCVLFLFAIGGPGSYYLAFKLNALIFLIPTNTVLTILCMDWFYLGLIFFLVVRWMRILQNRYSIS